MLRGGDHGEEKGVGNNVFAFVCIKSTRVYVHSAEHQVILLSAIDKNNIILFEMYFKIMYYKFLVKKKVKRVIDLNY